MASVIVSSTMCCVGATTIDNANKEGKYFISTDDILPEGCRIVDAAYAAFKFTGYTPGTVINGDMAFNTERGGWVALKWGSDNNDPANCKVELPFAVDDYPDAGSEIEIVRPINHDFEEPGRWSEIAVQYFYSTNDARIKITDVYFLDSNKQRLTAKTVTTEAPATEAAPAAITTATTKSDAAATTAKPSTNPSTGDSGVSMAVAAAMAALGVAVTFKRRNE